MNTALAHGMRELSAAEILMVSGGMDEPGGGGGGYGGGGQDFGGGGWDGGWGANDSGSTMDGFNSVFIGPDVNYSWSVSKQCITEVIYGTASGVVPGGLHSFLSKDWRGLVAGALIGGLFGIGTGCFNDNGGSNPEGSR